MDWFKFDISAYQRATEQLSGIEDGMYLRLMLAYYQREGPLPSDLETVYRLTHAVTRYEKAALRKALHHYFKQVNGHYTNPRADDEIEQYQRLIAGRSRAGAQGRAKQLLGQLAGTKKDTYKETVPPLPPSQLNPCQHRMENGSVCGNAGTHKLHPASKDWYCREHLDG